MASKYYVDESASTSSELHQYELCRDYNTPGGCRRPADTCSRLHICRHHFLSNCKYGNRCRRSHDTFEAQRRAELATVQFNLPGGEVTKLPSLTKSSGGNQGSEANKELASSNDIHRYPVASQLLHPRGEATLIQTAYVQTFSTKTNANKLLQGTVSESELLNISLTSFVQILSYVEQIISTHQQIPTEFLHSLTNELIKNQVLEKEFLLELQTIPELIKKYEHFDRTWNIKVASDVLHDLSPYVRVYLNRFQSVMGERISTLSKQRYLEVDTIVNRPLVSTCELQNFVSVIYPFMLQNIKMWGCQVLFSQQINSFIAKKTAMTKSTQLQSSEEKVHRKAPFSSRPKQNFINNPVARIDFITLLLGSADCLVASDIIRIMSKFPLAMPLVLCDLQKERYVFMLPLFRDVIIKWEANAGKIHENYLFRSPFKMVVSLRIGSNGKDRPGKSAIINQIMKKENFFSSRGEPGGKYGKPCTLDGSVEFTWLTEETCGDALWKQVLEPHYASGDNQLILLANLHGDINDYWHFFNMFELFSPSYLIFVMPVVSDDSVKPEDALKSAVIQGKLHYVFVDIENYDEEDYEDQCVIKTSLLHSDENLEMLRNSIAKAISTASIQQEIDVKLTGTRLVLAESPCTELSTAVIQFIKDNTCQSAKKHLKSVKCRMPKHAKTKTRLTTVTELSMLMSIFLQIFRRPIHEINKAILHLETELCFLSDTESLCARKDVQTLKDKHNTLFGLGKQNEENLKNIDLKLAKAMDKVDEIHFGLEHFFRELCDIYQANLSTAKPDKILLDLPSYCADLLLNGSAVELLNGDAGTLSIEWILAICKCVDKKRPNLRVFVLSIIGLQSSGKSTLLNALFSCKFSVAVGRCSRGLFMRLAFLRDCLVEEYGFDAFLLIDSEGLGSPEKMNDKKSEQNDRLMATLAMGVSDLTMINVFGESITQITEIMQIAILAMVRLEKTDMASDILVIQHLQERNELRLSAGKDSFCKALNEAFNLAQKHCTDIGALDIACLNNLIRRIQGDSFLKQFSPLRDGASVYAPPSEAYHRDVIDLYKSILSVSKELKHKHTLLTWSKIVGSYWSCAKEENFAVRFKNAKEMIEYIDRERKLASIRDSIEYTFGHHKVSYEHLMRRQINENNYDKNEYLLHVDNGLKYLPTRCPRTTSDTCQFCKNTQTLIDNIYKDVDGTDQEIETHELVEMYIKRIFSNARDMLSQMFDAMVVENKFCDKYSEIIHNELKLTVQSNPTGVFSPEQRNEAVSKIWNQLTRLAFEEKVSDPVIQKIEQEIPNAYGNNMNIVSIYRNPVEKADFWKTKAIDKDQRNIARRAISTIANLGTCEHISENKAHNLIRELENLIKQLFEREKTVQIFEPRMIRQLKINIDEAIERHVKDNQRTFLVAYRLMAHAYTLQKFTTDMEKKQMIWDSKHNPNVILEQKKQIYMQEIDARLKLGYTAAGDGYIALQTLHNAFKQIARRDVEKMLVDEIRDQPWTRSTENVRLTYFGELVVDIRSGETESALTHFRNPQCNIEEWFKEKVDTYSVDKANRKYEESFLDTVKCFLDQVGIDVDMKIVEQSIKEYISKTDIKHSFKHDTYLAVDSSSFKQNLIKGVNELKRDASEVAQFNPPSENDDVMRLLGCTECCRLCSALCWLGRGHDELNTKHVISSKHMSCHQPGGLGAVHYRFTGELLARACHDNPDNLTMYYGLEDEHLLWPEYKCQEAPTWSFDKHPNHKFEELMRWFFSNLHLDIAARSTHRRVMIKPAKKDDLQIYNCNNLNIDQILISIRNSVVI